MTVRTRFAPSPTGYLHIGGARTALYAWLFARKNNGTFILRIEDTDLERSTPESVDAILEGMQWLELNYDEGPFYQTKRFDRYHTIAEQLLKEGKAYRCYCSKERLETLRTHQMAHKQKPRYDGHCLNHPPANSNQSSVIRFRNPQTGAITFDDKVRGKVTFQNEELDDLIIVRSDGSPTYNFTVVVDDFDMKVTHVIRGDDHINNTPRQINILQELNAPIPIYAHVPMILGADGKRLSKRHGAVSVMQYRDEGYLPEALLNYLVRLGWSHGDQEIFTRDEMINAFNLDALNKSPAAFNPEKLLWLNQHYLKTLPEDYIADKLNWHMQQQNIDTEHGPALVEIVKAQRERCKTLVEMANKSKFFYQEPDIQFIKAELTNAPTEVTTALKLIQLQFSGLTNWEEIAIHEIIKNIAEQNDLKLGKIAQPLRLIITGITVSPPIDLTLRLLGKEKVLARLQQAL